MWYDYINRVQRRFAAFYEIPPTILASFYLGQFCQYAHGSGPRKNENADKKMDICYLLSQYVELQLE